MEIANIHPKVLVEQNVELAKAIGWPSDQIHVNGQVVWVGPRSHERAFNYRDHSTLWSLCVVYDAFPTQSVRLTDGPVEWVAASGKVKKVVTFRDESPEYAAYQAILHAAKHVKIKIVK